MPLEGKLTTIQCVLLTLMFLAVVMQGMSAAGRKTNIVGETQYTTAAGCSVVLSAMILLVTVPWFIWTFHV